MAKQQIAIMVTPKQLEAAFTEWLRRWQECPKATAKAAAALCTRHAPTYGQEVTPYFVSLLDELADAQA
jgi:hypothetical protein